MRRLQQEPRLDWQARVESTGLTYHAETNHWFEGAAYEFTSDEVDAIEAATAELHQLCLKAIEYLAAHPGELEAFRIPAEFHAYMLETFRRGDPYLVGRFDLGFDPASGAIKLLEYNADTPTLMIETAVTQWYWLQDKLPQRDQFNSLHEKLLAQLQTIGALLPPGERLYCAAMPDAWEELQHSVYLLDLAEQANIPAEAIAIPDIGWRSDSVMAAGAFVDQHGNQIRFLHKLYPWEWLTQEQFGGYLARDIVGIMEPAWKMLLSNKAILPLLWRLYPDHPNLLPSFMNKYAAGTSYVAKPILAREGANIDIVEDGQILATTGGTYSSSPRVYQQRFQMPANDGWHAVIGSWIVGEEPAGMIVRESRTLITDTNSHVVPHYF